MNGNKELSESEKKIVRELVKNPRISDNQLSKNTQIPVMTVNRKRKSLERDGYLRYFTSLDTGEHGTGKYKAKQMYIIKFKIGITRQDFIDVVEKDKLTTTEISSTPSFFNSAIRSGTSVLCPAAKLETPTACTSFSIACFATSSGVEKRGAKSTSKPASANAVATTLAPLS